MSQVYNIEIWTLGEKRMDLGEGELDINKTLEDIKNKIEERNGYKVGHISFITMKTKENTIIFHTYISDTPEEHQVYGNKYIDDLTIREVLNQISRRFKYIY